MSEKKIAIYVEGQTEQLFVNRLILTLWNYSDIKIRNIKLLSYQNIRSRVPDFLPDTDEDCILFVIIDVDGVGSLASAIGNRANNEQKKGFQILALRDLVDEEFHRLPVNIDRIGRVAQNFNQALQKMGCLHSEEIELYFSVMTIEAWLLAFTKAISKWAKTTEEMILQQIKNLDLEKIKAPSNILRDIGSDARTENLKSYHEMHSLISGITAEEIESVYQAKRVLHFNKFWERLVDVSLDKACRHPCKLVTK